MTEEGAEDRLLAAVVGDADDVDTSSSLLPPKPNMPKKPRRPLPAVVTVAIKDIG